MSADPSPWHPVAQYVEGEKHYLRLRNGMIVRNEGAPRRIRRLLGLSPRQFRKWKRARKAEATA